LHRDIHLHDNVTLSKLCESFSSTLNEGATGRRRLTIR